MQPTQRPSAHTRARPAGPPPRVRAGDASSLKSLLLKAVECLHTLDEAAFGSQLTPAQRAAAQSALTVASRFRSLQRLLGLRGRRPTAAALDVAVAAEQVRARPALTAPRARAPNARPDADFPSAPRRAAPTLRALRPAAFPLPGGTVPGRARGAAGLCAHPRRGAPSSPHSKNSAARAHRSACNAHASPELTIPPSRLAPACVPLNPCRCLSPSPSVPQVDSLLSPLKSELNWPLGARLPLDHTPARWELGWHLCAAAPDPPAARLAASAVLRRCDLAATALSPCPDSQPSPQPTPNITHT